MPGFGVALDTFGFNQVGGDFLGAYAANNLTPDFVADFENGIYGTGGALSNVSEMFTHTRSSNATVVDSDGLVKWGAHNLALNSATPATQSITVVSGADYTVECAGSGSITLSGAGTGTASDGSPVEITAGTTTLTLTVTGSLDRVWCYRSDLGGMQNNPDTGDSYVPTTSAAVYMRREDYASGAKRVLVEEAATQLLHTTDALVTQSHTVTAVAHTLHFTGTGTVTLSGVSTAGPLVGTGTGEGNRVSLTFTPTAGSLTLTVSGTVTNAQLETGSVPTSYIPNLAGSGTVTRAADSLYIPAANLPDYQTPTYLSDTLVTNGTFDTDLSNWSTGGSDSASISQNNGAARLVGNSYLYDQVTGLTAGNVYQITVDITSTNSQGSYRVGTTANAGDIYDSPTQNSATSLSHVFVSPGTSVFVTLKCEDTPGVTSAYIDFDNVVVRQIKPLSVCFALDGEATGDTLTLARWYADANNSIILSMGASDFTVSQEEGGTVDSVTGGSFTSGINVPVELASRHTSTAINGAESGVAFTANETPTALADLSSTDLYLAYSGGPIRLKSFRMWAEDIGDTGISEASA